ncbi:MAG: SDR family oxidoreductase [Deltaproteobacteria bacterium]|nr:SDR family oxidoreductase [Deltaproteobacteria bacterium]
MRALVTGAAVRVGRAIALELAASGFDLVLHYRRSDAAVREVAAACEARGVRVELVHADLASVHALEELVRTVLRGAPTLDLLVNNASAYEAVPFEAITPAVWDEMMAVNARAPFLLSQGLLPALRAARGLVVHLVDIGAQRPPAGYAHYSMSKAALAMLVRAMAVELAPEVRTVGISPGQVAWPPDYDEQTRARLAARIPLQRVGTPEDIARLVRFLATEAPYIHGEIIAVDGGLSSRY